MSALAPAATLAQREVVRFFREKSRVAGALGFPVLMWFLIGSGFGPQFRTYFFPGTAVLIALFAAIFSCASLIEDRRDGFLQAVLVSPVPRLSIVAGKIAGGALLAFPQAAIFLVVAPLVGIHFTPASLGIALLSLLLIAIEMTSLGFVVAWHMESTPGFHAIMNLILLPLWVLSGAFFPPGGASRFLQLVIAANPFTYGVAALQHATGVKTSGPSVAICLVISAAFAAFLLFLAGLLARQRRAADVA